MSHPTPVPPIVDLERLTWAFQGLAELCNPDQVLDGKERAYVSTLVQILAERLVQVCRALETDHAGLLRALERARAAHGSPPASKVPDQGGPHVSPDR
jgi:hypothetical protein